MLKNVLLILRKLPHPHSPKRERNVMPIIVKTILIQDEFLEEFSYSILMIKKKISNGWNTKSLWKEKIVHLHGYETQ